MKIADNNDVRISRRQWLKRVGAGAAALAVARGVSGSGAQALGSDGTWRLGP